MLSLLMLSIMVLMASTLAIMVLMVTEVIGSPVVIQSQPIGVPNILPYSIEECHTFNNAMFTVIVNIINPPENGLVRIGVPGQIGYRCVFHDQSIIQYGFKEGEINPHDEFYICVDDRDTGNLNCEVHRYLLKNNPETIDLTMKTLVHNK